MFNKFISRLFGNKQARDMRKVLPLVDEINAYCEEYQALDDSQLSAQTDEFRRRYADGVTLDDLLPEAFAVVKEACRRNLGKKWMAAGIEITWDMVPFDVQLAGAIVMHHGKIAEMATGEGKTLVAIMPLYLNAIAGKGVHLITVNDYLARRDSEWMGQIFNFLGMSVGCLDKTEPSTPERRAMYACDITYGTNHEFGFDYLRDNMVHEADQMVQQRGHFYAIVDEVDNILIDEARTPLIISGPVDRSTHRYDEIKPLVYDLVKKQNEIVNRYVSQAEETLKSNPKYEEGGMALLRAQRGLPKHKRLVKMRSEPGMQTLIEKTELGFMAEKRMYDVDEGLYYVVDEKGHQIDLTDLGRNTLSPTNPKLWEVPDIVEEIAAVEAGDFDLIELNDGQKLLLNGREHERAAAKKPDGSYEVHRHDGIQRIAAQKIVRIIPGSEVPQEERDTRKEDVRNEHAIQTEKLHNISQLLRAYSLYEKDVEYVVQDNKVIIVDEFTGRLMNGRRWSDGLHQAVECKEGVEIEIETQTLATITLQNYFRMYKKLAGMTGTAETEAAEFAHTYNTDVVVVPTNQPCIRADQNDLIYKTKREKYNAIISEIARCCQEKLPVLVGTVSVEVSELLSRMLARNKIPHNVLNAKNHQREAEIIRFAGQPGAVTIATNMAGRGTDIKLHPDVVHKDEKGRLTGGLQVIGTERHEARRIDRQLRGRSGRQGDPGRSIFCLSLEDDLMRLFGSERIARVMDRLGMQEGEEITHPLVTRAIESAQKKVETRNFEIRKKTLDYDNVMNKQREAIYGLRKEVITGGDLRDLVLSVHYEAVKNEINEFGDANRNSVEWDIEGFLTYLQRHIPYADFMPHIEQLRGHDADSFMTEILKLVAEAYEAKRKHLNNDQLMRDLCRWVILRRIDTNWIDHLLAIDDLRESIGWRGYAQLDPLVEYQKEASLLFEDLMFRVHKEVLENLFRTEPVIQGIAPPTGQIIRGMQARRASMDEIVPAAAMLTDSELQEMAEAGGAAPGDGRGRRAAGASQPSNVPYRAGPRVGRNDPCPCGSGKKFKKCCGGARVTIEDAG
ncbi:MAG: preprotein translocase subunit SecA [bacterium]|nr:preprotein translocase subunit SecA [Candidatus Sumerlaeota bacterium]